MVLVLASACESGSPQPAPVASEASTTAAAPASTPPAPSAPPLLDPKQSSGEAPATFKVALDTTKGEIVIEVRREWAPRAADRFYHLVKIGYYDDVAFFRVVKGFAAQFGLNGDPKVSQVWREATIDDEMARQPNKRGTVTFARRGSDTRSAQVFVNLKDNAELDDKGFPPFGEVVDGMKVVDSLHDGYGEQPSIGGGTEQILARGNAYLKEKFPKLDYIRKAKVLP
jgi:cyclophilin family peptidyl-prolyl cis-trans isomerase